MLLRNNCAMITVAAYDGLDFSFGDISVTNVQYIKFVSDNRLKVRANDIFSV